MLRGAPVVIIPALSKRDQGAAAQRSTIEAAKAVSDIIRTTLGPKSMTKMLLDPLGGITLTTDGNAVLREIDVGHPAAKCLVDLSRAQDEEKGDGTTSVVLLTAELLSLCEELLDDQIHVTHIISGLLKAYDDMVALMDAIAVTVDVANDAAFQKAVETCLKTKYSSRWGTFLPQLALQAVRLVSVDDGSKKDIDIKKYVRVEKIPGDNPEDTKIIQGIVVNKDVVHPKMRRRIVSPKVVLLDCPLEYKKGESQTNIEITEETHWEAILKQEEAEVQQMCEDLINSGCNVVLTEKGVSDLAQHFLAKADISVLRRVKKSDNNRLARVTGATIVNRTSELRPEDIGHDCGLFEIKKIGDEYYAFFTECTNPKACTILLRGGSKDVLNEIDRNLQDSLSAARSLMLDPKILPGGGATEMELSRRLAEKQLSVEGLQHWSYNVLSRALEVIPRTLLQNSGVSIVPKMDELRALHAKPGNSRIGVRGEDGQIVDVTTCDIWDVFATKQQVIKSAVEAATMLLRIDDIVSASSGKKKDAQPEIGPLDS